MCGKRALTLSGEKSMFEYHLEHILSYAAKLGEREVIGSVLEGLRINVHVTGGEVTGPKVSGKLRSLSGDLGDDSQRWGRYSRRACYDTD
jgi:hypothetical protein